MGRPENTISGSGAVADFARQLRLLRQHSALTLRQLAASTGLSTATLSVAAAGRGLPSWEVARAYVQACGGDPDDWRMRWEHAARFSRLPPAMRLAVRAGHAPGGQTRGTNRGLLGGPAPLPVTAETTSDFMDCLLRVKIWAGDPPVRALSRRTGLPPSTVQDFLRRERRRLPTVETVCTFLKACGVDDWNVIAEWIYAWRRLKFAESEERRHCAQRVLMSALWASKRGTLRLLWIRRQSGSAGEHDGALDPCCLASGS
jgi:transcriptional regulator with XRE-family HTH domain